MLTRAKLLFAAAIAVIALTAAAGSATAASFETSPAGAVNAVSQGKITFTTEAASIRCNLTLATNLTAGRIAKTAGTSIGNVEGVTWRECEGGEVRTVLFANEEPWNLTYESIAGTLPEGVTSVGLKLHNTAFQFSIFFGLVNCLYEGTVGSTLTTTHTSGARYSAERLTANSAERVSLVSGPEACPRTGTMAGTFRLSTTQTLTRS